MEGERVRSGRKQEKVDVHSTPTFNFPTMPQVSEYRKWLGGPRLDPPNLAGLVYALPVRFTEGVMPLLRAGVAGSSFHHASSREKSLKTPLMLALREFGKVRVPIWRGCTNIHHANSPNPLSANRIMAQSLVSA